MAMIFNERARVIVWHAQQNVGESVWGFNPYTGRRLEEVFAESVRVSLIRPSEASMQFVVVGTPKGPAVSGGFRLSLRGVSDPGVEKGSLQVIGHKIESAVSAREWQGISLVYPFVTPVGDAFVLIMDDQELPRVEGLEWYRGEYDAEYQPAIEAVLIPANNEIAFAIQRSKTLVVCDLETLDIKHRFSLPGDYNGAHVIEALSGLSSSQRTSTPSSSLTAIAGLSRVRSVYNSKSARRARLSEHLI